MPASVQIPRTSAPEQLPIFSASERRLIPRWSDILREWMRRIETRASGLLWGRTSESVFVRFGASERAGGDGPKKGYSCDTYPGGGNSILRSIRPGRSKAGSRMSIRFVAMMT